MVDVLGARLGRYDIRERIGRGGMATVYKAWDMNLDRWVAVKVLHDHLAEDADFQQRFEREAKLIAALSHPNVVQIYDFDQAERNGQPVYYMVMALIAGPTLRDVMERQHAKGERLSLSEINRVMESVCSALAYAHRQGITHRDVTPGNILFSDQGGIVLADFGLARLVSGARLTQSGMTTGTPVYMSPEQCLGLPSDARSDLYSLGVILFEMLSGEAPYGGDSAYAIIMKHVNAPVPPLPDPGQSLSSIASVGLTAVVGRALAKSPDDRYQSADDFLADFQQVVRGELPTRTTTAKMPTGGPSTSIRSGTVTTALPTDNISSAPHRLPPTRQPRVVVWVICVLVVIGVAIGALLVRSTTGQATHSATGGESMTDSTLLINNDFSKGAADKYAPWQLASADSRLTRQYTASALRIRNTLPRTATATVIDPQSAEYGDPYVIESTMTISADSQPASGTGIIFRYVSDAQYYVFAVDGMARVSIWELKNGTWTELRHQANKVQWTHADNAKPAGQPNDLRVIVNGDRLQGFVNDKLVINLDTQQSVDVSQGGVGIYVATVNDNAVTHPVAQVDVTSFSVSPHTANVPSMTGPEASSMTGPEATPTPQSATF
ncbi:MAG: protein kinase domain-containing protein [Aggregatilineales bacterium]